jgi:hypothetical protein
VKDLDYFLRVNFVQADAAIHLSLVQRDVPGSKITRRELDTIKAFPTTTEISVSGLTQDTFEYFVANYGSQFKAINFWKCPLVQDLTPLESLAEVEYIVYFWNQRADHLWHLSRNRTLKGFGFDDFTRLHDLSQVTSAPALQELHFGDKVWTKYVVNTLQPLSECSRLKVLTFSAKKIMDGRVEPLARLTNLERLEFPANQFTSRQVAWLKARLPQTIESMALGGYWTIANPIHHNGKNKDTVLVGKGKVLLIDSNADRPLLDRHIKEFNAMYYWFLRHPDALPEDYTKERGSLDRS